MRYMTTYTIIARVVANCRWSMAKTATSTCSK
jgi:hypothetical protein